MATTKETSVSAKDPLWSLTDNKVSIDSDTQSRNTRILSASVGGSGTFATPLNSGQQTRFEINNGSNWKYRWGTMGLRVHMVFTAGNNTNVTAAADGCSPCWNLVGHLFDNISLSVNNMSEPLFTASNRSFGHIFTAKLLRFFTREQLDAMSNVLFTPLPNGDDTYIIHSAEAGGGPALAGTTLARANRWIGAASHQRTITKIIPFSILFPAMPDAMWRNLNKIGITIQWINDRDILDRRITNAGAAAGSVYVLGCDIVTDEYVMSQQSSVAQTVEKLRGETDTIPYLQMECHTRRYIPGATISIPGIKNLDAVFIMQVASQHNNGKAGADLRTYWGAGQFILFGNSAGPNGLMPLRADYPVPAGGDYVSPITSVNMDLGGNTFSSAPLTCTRSTNGTVALDPAELYYMYLRSVAKTTRRESSAAIDEATFRSVMPFVFMRPWSDNAAHITPEGRELRITMTGGIDSTIQIVVFKLVIATLRPDGTMAINQ